jgi:hypothetical protein
MLHASYTCCCILLTAGGSTSNECIHQCRYLRKGKYAERMAAGTPVYLAAVLEYLAG